MEYSILSYTLYMYMLYYMLSCIHICSKDAQSLDIVPWNHSFIGICLP